ncbi:hypothetical protein HYV82_01730 [Candidatus Woesearchaeota archaeon]|nr:hypothetical protein [Candidatus Woesearchaeota archaeon]
MEKVVVVPEEVLEAHKERAIELVRDIDLDDALFIACALAYPKSVIWSDDKKLKRQNAIKILNTAEMMNLFKGM